MTSTAPERSRDQSSGELVSIPGYRLLSKQEAASVLGLTVRTLDRLITNRRIPYLRLPSAIRGRQGRVRFDSRDIGNWIQERRQEETEDERYTT